METWHISNAILGPSAYYGHLLLSFPYIQYSTKKFPNNFQIPNLSIGVVPLPSTTGINEGLLRDSPNPQKRFRKKKSCQKGDDELTTTWKGGQHFPQSPSTPRQSSKSSDLIQSWFRTKNEAITRRKGEVACTVNVNIWEELRQSIHVWYIYLH